MSKETDRLREKQLYNNYDLCAVAGSVVFVDYTAPDCSRSGFGTYSGWGVTLTDGRRFKDGIGNAVSRYGSRMFRGRKADKEVVRQALAFASRYNGATKWVRSPFGGYISQATADTHGIKYPAKSIINIALPDQSQEGVQSES